ncbi:sodium:solute symporter family protein [Castellaniella hirudinis]|uniref:sodium:solute symporter family protein n=1 Tax=Castellaniella hirudinis TaxID=1144617 RepID=UPI0039C435FD
MLSTFATLSWLIIFSIGFALAGIWYARRSRDNLEDFIVARNSQTATATILTLLASSLGAWILFSPAQAATWGGIGAITGYAIGSMSPRLTMIPLGQRMRELIPHGHTLTEFVMVRYGSGLYRLVLVIMMFYLFISLTAEITAIAKMVTLIAPIPLWVTGGIVLGCTLLYTAWGGLKASIFTDKIQMVIIVPLLGVLVLLGWQASGGIGHVTRTLQATAPQLLDFGNASGIKAGLTFFVAILLTGLFHQGNWQRVYAAQSTRAMRRGFLLGGLLVAPVIFLMGLFGLAFVAQGGGDDSVALFTVLIPNLPLWFAVALIPLGLSLVMSSADTAISAVSSMIAVDARRLLPHAPNDTLMRYAQIAIYVMAVPVWLVSAQGYSVLYLFLLADLLCSAAAFPVFYGLYSSQYNGRTALISTVGGLLAGLSVFPAPDGNMDTLLESFLLAALTPVAISIVLTRLWPSAHYDLQQMQHRIRSLQI